MHMQYISISVSLNQLHFNNEKKKKNKEVYIHIILYLNATILSFPQTSNFPSIRAQFFPMYSI